MRICVHVLSVFLAICSLATLAADEWAGRWEAATPNWTTDKQAIEELREFSKTCLSKNYYRYVLNLEPIGNRKYTGTLVQTGSVSIIGPSKIITPQEMRRRCKLKNTKVPLDGFQVKTWQLSGKQDEDGKRMRVIGYEGTCEDYDWCDGNTMWNVGPGISDFDTTFILHDGQLIDTYGTIDDKDDVTFLTSGEYQKIARQVTDEGERLFKYFNKRDASALVSEAHIDVRSKISKKTVIDFIDYLIDNFGNIKSVTAIEQIVSTQPYDEGTVHIVTFDLLMMNGIGRAYFSFVENENGTGWSNINVR